jgi:DNA-3-methyladenine glycosylase II
MIATEADLDKALDLVGRLDPVLARLRAEVGRPRLRKREPGFAGLVAIVIGQQVSTASAAAIWRRVADQFGDITPEAFAAASEATFRQCGLSAPKIRTMRAAAAAILSGACPLHALAHRPVDEAHAALVTIPGVGPWTADVYLLFCLGHPDAFPAGDLALQEAARLGYGMASRPGARELETLAEAWRPWRGAAATLLWGYYAVRKERGVDIPAPGASVSAGPVSGGRDAPLPDGRPCGSSAKPVPRRRNRDR